MEFEFEVKLSSAITFLLGVGIGVAVGMWAGSRRLGGLLRAQGPESRELADLESRAW